MRSLRALVHALKRRLFWTEAERRHALVGPAKQWQLKRQFQIDFLKARGLEPGHSLLDLGCGTLRGGIPIIEFLDEGRYVGFEPRAKVADEARRELADAGLEHKQPQVLQAEQIEALSLDRRFDFVWAFSVLIHMSDEILFRTLAFVAAHLAPGGVFLANVNVGEREEGAWQGFPVVWRSESFYRSAAADAGLVVEDVGALRELGHCSGNESQDAQRMLRFTLAG